VLPGASPLHSPKDILLQHQHRGSSFYRDLKSPSTLPSLSPSLSRSDKRKLCKREAVLLSQADKVKIHALVGDQHHTFEDVSELLKHRLIDAANPLFFDTCPPGMNEEPPTIRIEGLPLELGLVVTEFGDDFAHLRELILHFTHICEEKILLRLELFVNNFNIEAFAKEIAFIAECVSSIRADVTADAAYILLNYLARNREHITPAILRKASSAMFRTLDEFLQYVSTCFTSSLYQKQSSSSLYFL
jgi:hypothetical protein